MGSGFNGFEVWGSSLECRVSGLGLKILGLRIKVLESGSLPGPQRTGTLLAEKPWKQRAQKGYWSTRLWACLRGFRGQNTGPK